MAAKADHGTGIEWTHVPGYKGETWNPVRGCTKISPGCKHCYAETFAKRWRGIPGHPYEQGFDLRLVPEKLSEPLHATKPRAYFVNSMSDLHQDGIPADFVRRTYEIMGACNKHVFMVLTKRAQNMADAMSSMMDFWGPSGRTWGEGLPSNAWLGVSVEDRKYGLPRVDILRTIPAAVRFLSVEPLLEDLGDIDLTGIHWVIVGGESGPGARPFDFQWARRIVGQCIAHDVPVFVKQVGANPRETTNGVSRLVQIKSSKGGALEELPPDLRIREFPKVVPSCA